MIVFAHFIRLKYECVSPVIKGGIPRKYFVSPTKGKLTIEEVVSDIYDFLSHEPDLNYHLIIGSDSHERCWKNQKTTNFITAIIVHRVGFGGKYYWQNGLKKTTHSLREKIYQETLLSIDLAGQLVPLLNQKLNGHQNWDLEIHIDVGRSGQTRDMIKEVVGMVVGNGYSAKTKPDSFAATTIADRHT